MKCNFSNNKFFKIRIIYKIKFNKYNYNNVKHNKNMKIFKNKFKRMRIPKN
jgi:hypothetical protein